MESPRACITWTTERGSDGARQADEVVLGAILGRGARQGDGARPASWAVERSRRRAVDRRGPADGGFSRRRLPHRSDRTARWRGGRTGCVGARALSRAPCNAGAEDPIEAVSRSTGIDRNRVELAAAIPPPIPTQSTTESASATRRPNACGARWTRPPSLSGGSRTSRSRHSAPGAARSSARGGARRDPRRRRRPSRCPRQAARGARRPSRPCSCA